METTDELLKSLDDALIKLRETNEILGAVMRDINELKKSTGIQLRLICKECGRRPARVEGLCHRCYYQKLTAKTNCENSEDAMRIKREQPLDVLNISTRAYNCLRRAGCKTVGDVADLASGGKLIELRNLGVGTEKEIKAALNFIGV